MTGQKGRVTLVIGHRGVGKTTFLARVAKYYQEADREVRCLDLDAEIVRRSGRSINDIFSLEGEQAFRVLELKTLRELLSEVSATSGDVYVSLGAGFELEKWSGENQLLWLRRPSDARGRVFVDGVRPRLNSEVPPLEEFQLKFAEREARYRHVATEVLIVDEGLENSDEAEKTWILGTAEQIGGAITVFSTQLERPTSFFEWLSERLRWGVHFFELRDDLLSDEQMREVLKNLPADRALLSFRSSDRIASTRKLCEEFQIPVANIDWPLELGPAPFEHRGIFSLHERGAGQTVSAALASLPKGECALLKAALPVHHFSDLHEGHRWQKADSERRVFLPLSPDGRWSWYRLLRASDFKLNFFREGDGSGADQPTILQWTRAMRAWRENQPSQNANTNFFAAVLGDPVAHSRTPLEQGEFFRKTRGVFSIRVSETDWREGALDVLRELGLRWVAVTAPLKNLAYQSAQVRTAVADELQAVNTLMWRGSAHEGKWSGTNTDLVGFEKALPDFRSAPVAIWGGGGTLKMMQKALPQAVFFSARSGENRNPQGPSAEEFAPHALIWGASVEGGASLPTSWRPQIVMDLSYAEDSAARTFALQVGARYISGLAMFRHQAEAQRQFWKSST
jgi:shikimate 5-dehydrogenase/shikimate kinase